MKEKSMIGRRLFTHVALALGLAASTLSGTAQSAASAKNVIIFIGDGTGLSSLNAASIYGYNKPQALFIQSLPGIALADTSTATQWVTDGGAGATAIATGVKTSNGILSQSASAINNQQDGEILKTFFEYMRGSTAFPPVPSRTMTGRV
jgi:alkaline phosphatase